MATYDLAYPGAAIDAILNTAYFLQEAGYIFQGSASEYSGTPSKRVWLIAPAGFTGYGISSPVPQGSIGICLYNGNSWVGKIINVATIDSTPTQNSGNAVSSGGAYAAINQLSASVTEALENLTFTDTTPSAFQDEYINMKVSTTEGGVERILTYLTILAATTSKAGLLSAADKVKIDSFLTNLRSLTFADTTASADQGTKITETLKATIGGVQEVIDSITLLAATSSKAGLLSAADKAKLDALWSSGYQFAGIATPSTTPLSTTSKIFYIATEAGTYFNAVTITQGINILSWDGTAWNAVQVVGIDDEPTAGSNNLIISNPVWHDVMGEKYVTGQLPLVIEQGGLTVDGGIPYNDKRVIRTNFIDIRDVTNITLINPEQLQCRLFEYDAAKAFIRSYIPDNSVSIQEGVAYIRIRMNYGSEEITPSSAGGFAIVSSMSYFSEKMDSLTKYDSEIEKKIGILNIGDWEQGGLYAGSGLPYNTTMAIRTDFIQASGIINICNPNGESWKIYQYDENKEFVRGRAAKTDAYYQYELGDEIEYIRLQLNDDEGIVPSRAEGFYITDSTSYYTHMLAQLQEEINTKEEGKSISILFVGNSLTQDGIAYLPYMLKTYYPEISFKFYMWYNGGYTLAQQYEKFINDNTASIFSVAENVASWTNFNSSKTMQQILSTYTFDIVCMQEYFNYKSSYTDADLADWNNCRDYIRSHYTGGNGIEFISLFHAPLRASYESIEAMTEHGNALILQKTISQDMIPIGMAVYNAMSTSLDSLGDQGHLSPDGTHTQEGLPCLLQTFTALCWLFDKLSVNKSIYGSPMRMTTEIYQSINVPGPNLGTGVITGTDAENILAQEVAIKSYKEGKSFVAANIYKE